MTNWYAVDDFWINLLYVHAPHFLCIRSIKNIYNIFMTNFLCSFQVDRERHKIAAGNHCLDFMLIRNPGREP